MCFVIKNLLGIVHKITKERQTFKIILNALLKTSQNLSIPVEILSFLWGL